MKVCWKENAQAVASGLKKEKATYEEHKVKYLNLSCPDFFDLIKVILQ